MVWNHLDGKSHKQLCHIGIKLSLSTGMSVHLDLCNEPDIPGNKIAIKLGCTKNMIIWNGLVVETTMNKELDSTILL